MIEHAGIPETKMLVVHEGGRLVHCNGADLIMYKGKDFKFRIFEPPSAAILYAGHAASAEEVRRYYQNWRDRSNKSPGVVLGSSTSVTVRRGRVEVWNENRPI